MPRGRHDIFAAQRVGTIPLSNCQRPVLATQSIIRRFVPSGVTSCLVLFAGTGTDVIAALEEGFTNIMAVDVSAASIAAMAKRLEMYDNATRARYAAAAAQASTLQFVIDDCLYCQPCCYLITLINVIIGLLICMLPS